MRRSSPTRLLAVACAAGLLAACASGGASSSANPTTSGPDRKPLGTVGGTQLVMTGGPTVDVTALAAPLAPSWTALRQTYDSLGIPVATQDPAAHRLGNEGWRIRQRLGRTPLSRSLDCGSSQIGPNADTYDVQLTVLSTLAGTGPTATTLRTTVEATARPATYAQGWQACSSRGELEARIAAGVKARLAR